MANHLVADLKEPLSHGQQTFESIYWVDTLLRPESTLFQMMSNYHRNGYYI
jgi:hypothetical protein